jgi:predicted RNA-binding Zn ribbon-like protein
MPKQGSTTSFVADAIALDFLNSAGTLENEQMDWILDGEGRLGWLAQAKLVPADVLVALRRDVVPKELEALARQARSLREWFRGFVTAHMGRPLPTNAIEWLAPLDRLLERDENYRQVFTGKYEGQSGLRLHHVRRWRAIDSLLLPIEDALASFVCEEDFENVKACERHPCALLFVDHTRGRTRKWCSMGTCGNRAKQAAHRRRQRTAS